MAFAPICLVESFIFQSYLLTLTLSVLQHPQHGQRVKFLGVRLSLKYLKPHLVVVLHEYDAVKEVLMGQAEEFSG